MTTQMQQARDVFNEANITPSGESLAPPPEEEVNQNDGQEEVHIEPQQEEVSENAVQEEVEEVQEEIVDTGEAPESYTVDSLAKAIGFETSDLYELLKIPMKDGQDPVSLGDIKTQFTDISRENNTLKTQLTDMQGQLEMAKSGGPVGINNELAQTDAYINQLKASMNSEEMKEWREFDQTRYLIESNDIKEKIDEAYTYANQLNQKQVIDNNAMMESFKLKYVELIPTWSDETVKTQDQAVMKGYMQSKGWTDAEIGQMADPRIQVIVKELIDLRAEKSAASEAVNKVRKAPKMIGNGRRAPVAAKADKTTSLVSKAKQTKNKGDLLNAARAVLGSPAPDTSGQRYQRVKQS